jgi:hypothetical protein
MQPLRFIQQDIVANPSQRRTLQLPARPTKLDKLAFANFADRLSQISFFANQGNQDSRSTNAPREDYCTPEQFRMKCVGKTCCATLRVPLPA